MSSDEMTFQMMMKRLKSCVICAQWFDSQQSVTLILAFKVSLAHLCSSHLKKGGADCLSSHSYLFKTFASP